MQHVRVGYHPRPKRQRPERTATGSAFRAAERKRLFSRETVLSMGCLGHQKSKGVQNLLRHTPEEKIHWDSSSTDRRTAPSSGGQVLRPKAASRCTRPSVPLAPRLRLLTTARDAHAYTAPERKVWAALICL